MKTKKIMALVCAFAVAAAGMAGVPAVSEVLGVDTAVAASADNKPTSGTCGANATWTLSDDGTLTISGTGEMYDYNRSPWVSDYRVKAVVIQPGITRIGNYAFCDCPYFTSLSIPSTVKYIGSRAFERAGKFTILNIPYGVEEIGDYCFHGISGGDGVVNVSLPSSLTTLGQGVFYSADITNITIPSSVTALPYEAFYYSSLERITLPDTLKSLGGYSLSHTNIKSVTLPGSLNVIGKNAFGGCSKLTSITIPDSVTDVERNAFEYCSALSSVTLSKNMTAISVNTFYSCSSLVTIDIPGNIKEIGENAFSACSYLTTVNLAEGVTSLGMNAFFNCSKLMSLKIPKSVNEIHNYSQMNLADGKVKADFTIYGYHNSAADTYAQKNNIKIVYLDSEIAPGDVDGMGGKPTNEDLALLQQKVAGWNVEVNAVGADVNADGKINGEDIALLQKYLAGWNVTLGKQA